MIASNTSKALLKRPVFPVRLSPRGWSARVLCRWTLAGLLLACCALCPAQEQSASKTTHISAAEANQLFSLIDQILQFSSQESGLPVQGAVKHKLIKRSEVESYLKKKMAEDQDAQRLESSEIVLKKLGYLDRDFELKPFLLALLTEEIEAFYDSKTKSISLLDWVALDEQKPVLAHELTHALQDQHVGMDKWMDQTPADVSSEAAGDRDHVRRDEMDTAREAVAEGQATAVMLQYILKPMGKSLTGDPEVVETIRDKMDSPGDSPLMARAPLLLSESMLFPYRDGLMFTQDLWMDQGRQAAFAGALDRPPASSWEILNPRFYENRQQPPVPLLPNIHPLVDGLYKPYDIGQMGQLDVHILNQLLGGEQADGELTPAWDGGIYWAGQLRTARTAAEQNSTQYIALFYLSSWKSAEAAAAFAELYAEGLGRKYSGLKPLQAAADPARNSADEELLFSTSEGTMVIITRGTQVFVAESFDLPLARKLGALLLDAQGSGAVRTAEAAPASAMPEADAAAPRESLSSTLVRFLSGCGVTRSAVQAIRQSAKELQ